MGQVIDFFKNLFGTESWPPRWYCGEWTDFHGWLYILSDLAIWGAYFAIPLLLFNILSKRKRIPFLSIFWLFIAFILLCGMTHLMDAIIFWWPGYRLSALVRFVTAIVSWTTVVALAKIIPEALSLKSNREFEIALEKRKASEERFRNLLENAPDALVIANANGEMEIVNKQCENIFGYTKEELIGKKLEMLMPDRFAKGHGKHRKGFFANPKVRPMGSGLELWGKRKDGSEFPIEISLSPLTTEGELLVSAAIRDTTERKEADKKLKEYNTKLNQKNEEFGIEIEKRKASEIRFKNLLENAPDALVIANASGEIELVNKQCENIFGYEKEELIGKKLEMLMPQRFAKGHDKHREGFFANPKVRPMGSGLDLWGKRKDGSEFPIEISLSPLSTEGELLVSAAIRDVTERKEANKKLKEYNNKLNQKNRELEQFVYVASHDLQEPVRTIISFVNLFQMEFGEQLSDEAKEYLGYIQGAGERSQQLIIDLLEYSRLGKNSHMTMVDMKKVAQNALDDLSSKIREKNAKVIIGDLPTLMGQETSLRLLIQNLVGNAIKFSKPDQSPEIRIDAEETDTGWTFSVKDNGIGFSDEFKDKIFVIFKRLHTRNEYGGTGIGLAHCKKIVEMHNGEIWADSEPEKGSTFYFTISNQLNEKAKLHTAGG